MAGGKYVPLIDNTNVVLDDLSSEIVNTISYTRLYADDMKALLTDGVEKLQDIISDYSPPKLDHINTEIDSVDRPLLPTPPNLDETFVSCVWDSLCSKISQDLSDGGAGLTEPVYNAIIAREQESRRINQEREYRSALDGVGEHGFNLPGGQIAALQSEIFRERLQKDQESLNNIIVKDFDLASENTRFAVTTAVELEKLLLAGWESKEKNKVMLYDSETKAVSAQYKALTDWVTAEVDIIRVRVESAIAEGRYDMDAYQSMISLSERIVESIVNVSAQGVASALGAINTSISNGYTGSESRRESWGRTQGLTEGHSFSGAEQE